eukprot:GHVL01026058.1.p1 GENE.GHVL01026058.1~~GHVL01026058.1.p1  ORF type:complete len:864 (+),score=79.95 GHVL01026058.1:171-2762(+)
MSDKAVLWAISLKTKAEVRFFDLVEIRCISFAEPKNAFLCVGKHGLFFMTTNMTYLVKEGFLSYSVVVRVTIDTDDPSRFMLNLSSERPKHFDEQLFFSSQNRGKLLDSIQVAWQTDYMYRTNKVKPLPKLETSLEKKAASQGKHFSSKRIVSVYPFKGYKSFVYEGFRFFLRKDFEDRPNALSLKSTGDYVDPIGGFEVSIHAHGALPTYQLAEIGREHIRWVAMEYKRSMTEHLKSFVMLRNNAYTKKMNLSADESEWTGWELMVESIEGDTGGKIMCCILLRRSYIPPLLDTCQDFALIFRINKSLVDEDPNKMKELLIDCHLAADSFHSTAEKHKVYLDIVQAKLNALLFTDEACRWLETRYSRAHQRIRPSIYNEAKVFLKSILMTLKNHASSFDVSNLLECTELKGTIFEDNPMIVINRIESEAENMRDEETQQQTYKHQWMMRVARYFAYCVDGGILGARFTLTDLTSPTISQGDPECEKIIRTVIEYLLHLRPIDLTKRFSGTNNVQLIRDESFSDYFVFNDRVLTVMLESGYLKRLFPKGNEVHYSNLLSVLLGSRASINLKAGICRQILQSVSTATPQDQVAVIVPALTELMRSQSSFLATYATAALVNLSADRDEVKSALMAQGASQICKQNLDTKDDDLSLYTLILLVNLTKSVHHRASIVSHGVISTLVDLLSSIYGNWKSKHRMLAQLAAVCGQLCNDEESRNEFCRNTYKNIPLIAFLQVFQQAHTEVAVTDQTYIPFKTKILFVLKQMCQHGSQNKDYIGRHLLHAVLRDLVNVRKDATDYIFNSLLLLIQLSRLRENCRRIGESEHYTRALDRVKSDFQKNVAIMEKIVILEKEVHRQIHREVFLG